MNSILPRLKEMLEFDQTRLPPSKSDYTKGWIDGSEKENARLQPLLTRLVECVEALDKIWDLDNSPAALIAEEALQALRDEVDSKPIDPNRLCNPRGEK